ncbi:serine hydrolase domain-containing protein [Rhodohalobacter sp. 614A]|uniref:serine hydrolase domain-containing protein n=1 Tax=Rhodohalobacter sp. 614A TaxID=2908649 RepID=UPI001F377F57|nr:serine hydrolase domain-containing protein [Rhodohalobacter sp. 614A]
MRYLKSFTFSCLIFLFVANTPANAQQNFDARKLDDFLSVLEENNKFMGSVAILDGDEVLFNEAYGFIDDSEESANSETVYRIGSITKTYTAAIILKLEEEGKIDLAAKLSEFYTDIPNADQISIENLLNHRSGLVNVTNVPEYSEYYTESVTHEEMLGRIKRYGTSFEPGEKYEYSNTGYILLGYIIEDVTAMSYADVLKEFITDPLDLNRTYYGGEISTNRGEAYSFNYSPEGWKQTPQTNMSIPHGAGAIVSTPTETAVFLNALFNGELISEGSLEKMKDLKDGYGMGIVRIPFYDKYAWGHNGGIDGFQTTSGHFPEENVTFVLFGNGFNYSLNDISIGVLNILFGREFEIPDFSEEPKQVQLSEQEMLAFTGSYSSEDISLKMEVFVESGVLKAQASGQGAFPLTAYENGIMKFEQAGITMVFENLVDDKFEEFELQQAGQKYAYSRNE